MAGSGLACRSPLPSLEPWQSVQQQLDHWLVIPLYGSVDPTAAQVHQSLLVAGFGVVFVDNNLEPTSQLEPSLASPVCRLLRNANRGGLAGGLNRGIAEALQAGASFITLLDQDSRVTPADLACLREPLQRHPHQRLLVGPRIWDQKRQRWHQSTSQFWHGYARVRLLISSGTTFAAKHWPYLGPLDEFLFIDFVDHAWCFRAQRAGFVLLQHPGSRLAQEFGSRHPNLFCHKLGLEFYSPQRHYYSLRNLRWLILQRWIPLDLRCKEIIKMLFKPWFWLLFEPGRRANIAAIVAALTAPLPPSA